MSDSDSDDQSNVPSSASEQQQQQSTTSKAGINLSEFLANPELFEKFAMRFPLDRFIF